MRVMLAKVWNLALEGQFFWKIMLTKMCRHPAIKNNTKPIPVVAGSTNAKTP